MSVVTHLPHCLPPQEQSLQVSSTVLNDFLQAFFRVLVVSLALVIDIAPAVLDSQFAFHFIKWRPFDNSFKCSPTCRRGSSMIRILYMFASVAYPFSNEAETILCNVIV